MPGHRVAYILLWFPEPTQTFILDEVNTLVRLGLDVEVFTLYGPRHPLLLEGMALPEAPVTHLGIASLDFLLRELGHLKRHGGPEAASFVRRVLLRHWRSLETAGEAFWATLAAPYLARRFQAAGISHIHAPWANGPATAAWVASRLSGIPFSFCGHAHDIYPPDGALREKIAAASLVRVISEVNRRYLEGLVPEAAEKIVTIHCGVPLQPSLASPSSGGHPYHLLTIGRLVPKKGFPVLLAACRHLRDQGLDFRLSIAGDGPQHNQLLGLVQEYDLSQQVTLTGFVPHREVSPLLRQSDLFIMPCIIDKSGDRDGIPVVILEAMAHEVPVVATSVSGIPEAVRPGETGWLTPPDDPLALAGAIMEALGNPQESRRRAGLAREWVEQEFDSKTNYSRLKALFEGLASQKGEERRTAKLVRSGSTVTSLVRIPASELPGTGSITQSRVEKLPYRNRAELIKGLEATGDGALRVAYILLWFPEPSQTFILEEVNTLVRLGLGVQVYTLYGPRPPGITSGMSPALAPVTHLGQTAAGELLKDFTHLGREWGPGAVNFVRQVLLRHWRSLETTGEALWAVMAGVHLAKEFQAAGIRHIHAPWADGPATTAWVASRLSGIPFSFSARARDLHPPDGALLEKLAAASLVRTNTRSNERYLASLAPREAAKIINIYNGASLPPRPAPDRSWQPPFRLLALGRLVPKKGYDVLLTACRLLAREGFCFHLTLAGEGPEHHKFRRLIEKYGLKGQVNLVGFVPHREVPRLFQEADLFIMPSLIAPSGDRDGIPNVVLEALLHEVPVVATDISGLPEVIHPPETGWLVPPDDPENLARAVREACSNPTEARRRALAGRDLVAREFDSVRNYSELMALFVKLISQPLVPDELIH